MKKFIIFAILMTVTTPLVAQSGTNSPYSQYGLGALCEPATGFNRGMNGLGIAFREHNQINITNPASYSVIDSLSFIFDVGMSGQLTNFEQNGKRLNAKTANIEYIVAGFRAARHLGVTFGILPYTTIGYSYSNTEKIDRQNTGSEVAYTNTYSGSGGLHQAYVGAGWEPLKGLSIGANVGYLWGSMNRSIVNSYSNAAVNTLAKYYTASAKSYKADFGLQYKLRLTGKDYVSIGVTYGLGHRLDADPTCWVISTNTQTSVSDTTKYVVEKGLEIPTTYGAGIMYNHAEKWKVGFDYQQQQWAQIDFPVYSVENEIPQYTLRSGYYKDRQKFTFGGEYCQNEMGRKFIDRIRYRAGVSYSTPYLYINGQDGPKELSISAGFGIPIMNKNNYRSILNISGQWVQQEAKGLIKENTFRINVGLTFNERWFAKWKVE
ncbi:MAG: hypothetical protein IJ196_00400 [Prevotella sp.]|nr:hypothetical protein [Prevotella sp.]